MRRSVIFSLLLVAAISITARADVSIGVTAGDDGIKSFYLAVGDFFKVPQADFTYVREQRIPDDELAVVFYISQRTGCRPQAIMELRRLHKSWQEIAVHFGMSPAMFYVPITVEDPGPPYGKAYGHFKKGSKSQWKKAVLDDDDIVNLVNLRMLAGYYRVPADQIVRSRCEGRTFVTIGQDLKKAPPKEDNKAERAQKRQKAKQRAHADKD